ncbi:hypothetical protein [Petrachloros mirabilis]
MIQIIFLTLVVFIVGVSVFSVCRVFAPAVLLFEIQPDTRWNACRPWLSFAWSIVGWIALLILGLKLHYCSELLSCTPQLSWSTAALVLVGFLGITGYVPSTMMRLASKARERGFKLGERLSRP